MLKNILLTSLVIYSLKIMGVSCNGKYPNPLTDICWKCLFPMRIGPAPITAGETPNSDPPPSLVCSCPAPPPLFKRVGVGISFWEPARIAEVVRTPMCFPTLNGSIMGGKNIGNGMNSSKGHRSGHAFYHVHWLQYPILNWLGMIIATGACFTDETLDVAYLSEFDPLWGDDELAFILNPEAALFANPISQLACAADAVSATVKDFGLDPLFWCSGSQGSVYPLDGTVADHTSGVDSSLLLVHRMLFKLHRQGMAQDTSTSAAMCYNMPQLVMRKQQYKQQMMYPIPNPVKGYGFGKASSLWAAGREFPYKGEDFSYLVWRKRQCCAY